MSNIKINYKTRQRDLLLDFVKSTSGSHFTAEDVKIYCEKNHILLGTATIYRGLEKLLDEHFINRYFLDDKSAACYEYVGETERDLKNHFHLKCESCGNLIHLECSDLDSIKNHLLQKHGFLLNSFKTVFYGVCNECQMRGEKNA